MGCGRSRSEFSFPPIYSWVCLQCQVADNASRLAYNLSPSFNWKQAMEKNDQETYIKRLGELGYCWQFIVSVPLFPFHPRFAPPISSLHHPSPPFESPL